MKNSIWIPHEASKLLQTKLPLMGSVVVIRVEYEVIVKHLIRLPAKL